MLNVQNADVYTDFIGLANLKNQARKESPEALKEVAKQFEAIFLSSVLKGMRQAKLADGIMDNDQSKFYNEMYDQQLAVHLSGKPGVGLADLIVKQLSHDQPDNEKPGLKNYLNRPADSLKIMPQNPRAVSSRVDADAAGSRIIINSYTQQGDPFDEMSEIPLKDNQDLPIQSAEDFIRQLHPYAEQAAKELGVEPKVILAQAALETGWGSSLIKNSNGGNSFNLFNIKADKSWQGKQARVPTLEFEQGVAKKVNAGFRSYASFQESFKDYVDFIKSNPRYGDALKQAGNGERYMFELQQAGYATDPNYANKVMSIYHGNTMAGFEPETVMAMQQ
ncbi:MAG: flagellar assembly peptidoglycan hydrolase FlgJ [Methylococcales bacterium]|nr:flagellar assembly peptidoglycan hydrolase FlgJ [Methylococcales bacterium]